MRNITTARLLLVCVTFKLSPGESQESGSKYVRRNTSFSPNQPTSEAAQAAATSCHISPEHIVRQGLKRHGRHRCSQHPETGGSARGKMRGFSGAQRVREPVAACDGYARKTLSHHLPRAPAPIPAIGDLALPSSGAV